MQRKNERPRPTGCRYTIVGNYHDLSSRPRVVVEPIESHHPRVVEWGELVVEATRMERIIQEGVDEINKARKQDPWFDSEYAWNPREQAWTRRTSKERLPPLPRQLFEDKKNVKTHMRQVKSDIAVGQREVKNPAEVRRARTHEQLLHYINTAQVNLQHPVAHHQGHHDKHMVNNSQRAARKEQPQGQQPIEDYHPELDAIDKMFSDDEKKNTPKICHKGHLESRQHDPAQHRQPAPGPVFARVHSSKRMPAQRHTPQPQRPVLHRIDTYVENLPNQDKSQQHHRHHGHPRQLTKAPARKMGEQHEDTTPHHGSKERRSGKREQSDSHALAQGDQAPPHHKQAPDALSHVEGMQFIKPGGHLTIDGGAKIPRNSMFIVGPDSYGHPTYHVTPRAAITAKKSLEDDPSYPNVQGEEEVHLDPKERLRRAMIAESNEEAVCSDDEEDEDIPRAQPPALQQEQKQDIIACTASRSRSDFSQQQLSDAARGEEEKEEEPVGPKELLRRAIMAKENEDVICSDEEEESETDDEQTLKAPPPSSRQQQQVAAGPSSQSRACKQEDARRRRLHKILPKGSKSQDAIQNEKEGEEAAPADIKQATPTPCVSGGSTPSSLLTQSLLEQRAAAEDDDNNATDSMPTHQNQEEDHQQGPPYPPIVTTELCEQEAARCGVRVISEYIHDVPARLEAQKMATLKSKLRLAAYLEMGHRTGFQLQRIGNEKEESVKAKDDRKDPKEGLRKDPKGKTQKEEKLHYVSDYHYDHLREQPIPNCGLRHPW